jgi:hypothetical protein
MKRFALYFVRVRVADLMELEPSERVTRLWRRLIPLGERDYDGFPRAVKDFFAVYEWLGEVSNGGLQQYFSNSSGRRAGDLRTGLQALGDKDALKLFERTLGAGGGRAKDVALLEKLDARINKTSPRIVKALAAFVSREAAAFAFLDRHPGGYKALPLPEDLRPDPSWTPYEAVTFGYAALRDSTSSAARDFLDVFAWADEVSAGGFRGWFFSRDADRRPRVLELLDRMGPPEAPALLREALAVFPAVLDLKKRRKALAALRPRALEKLASLSRDFQRLREAVTTSLARTLAAAGR